MSSELITQALLHAFFLYTGYYFGRRLSPITDVKQIKRELERKGIIKSDVGPVMRPTATSINMPQKMKEELEEVDSLLSRTIGKK